MLAARRFTAPMMTPRVSYIAARRFTAEAAQQQPLGATPTETVWQKVRKELMKILKMQLVLFPIAFAFTLWMYPPLSDKEEKSLKERYEKHAGWKT